MGAITSRLVTWNGLVSRHGNRVRGRQHHEAEDERERTAVPQNINDVVDAIHNALAKYRKELVWETVTSAAGIPPNRRHAVLEHICEHRKKLGIVIRHDRCWVMLSLARQ